ncbi:MAG: hypothetical protein ACYTG3_10100 [Planctomycetota bacterium]|jgi:hypothetical protein
MTSQTSGRMGGSRALLLGVLVVLGTIAVIISFRGDDAVDETQAAPEPADEAVVEVTPLLPSRAITAASWRDEDNTDPRLAAAEAEAEEAESASLLDGVEFGDEGDKRRRYEKSVEKTVSDIEGLGVYVAPETDVDEPKKKKK